jgi:hypothetical protein
VGKICNQECNPDCNPKSNRKCNPAETFCNSIRNHTCNTNDLQLLLIFVMSIASVTVGDATTREFAAAHHLAADSEYREIFAAIDNFPMFAACRERFGLRTVGERKGNSWGRLDSIIKKDRTTFATSTCTSDDPIVHFPHYRRRWLERQDKRDAKHSTRDAKNSTRNTKHSTRREKSTKSRKRHRSRSPSTSSSSSESPSAVSGSSSSSSPSSPPSPNPTTAHSKRQKSHVSSSAKAAEFSQMRTQVAELTATVTQLQSEIDRRFTACESKLTSHDNILANATSLPRTEAPSPTESALTSTIRTGAAANVAPAPVQYADSELEVINAEQKTHVGSEIKRFGYTGQISKPLASALNVDIQYAKSMAVMAYGNCLFQACQIGKGQWTQSHMRKNKNPHSKGHAEIKKATADFRQLCARTLREWDTTKWLTTVPWAGCRQQLLDMARTSGFTNTKLFVEDMMGKDNIYSDSVAFYVVAAVLQVQIIEVWSTISFLSSYHPKIYGNPDHPLIVVLFNGRNHWEVFSFDKVTVFEKNSTIHRQFMRLPPYVTETTDVPDAEMQFVET